MIAAARSTRLGFSGACAGPEIAAAGSTRSVRPSACFGERRRAPHRDRVASAALGFVKCRVGGFDEVLRAAGFAADLYRRKRRHPDTDSDGPRGRSLVRYAQPFRNLERLAGLDAG